MAALFATAFCGTLIGAATPDSGGGPPTFLGLGDLPGSPFRSEAMAISADGLTIVGVGNAVYESSTLRYGEAFRWTPEEGMIGLGQLPGGSEFTAARGVSANGGVIVGWADPDPGLGGPSVAFRWISGQGITILPDIPGGIDSAIAHAASADGGIVVGAGNSVHGPEAFRWTAATGTVGLGDLPGGVFSSAAFGISADGSVIVGSSATEEAFEAFRWTIWSGMAGLGSLPGGAALSVARGVSADGSAIVGHATSSNGFEAFRWRSDTGMIGLGDLPGGDFVSAAIAVSGDGRIVVGHGTTGLNQTRAFVWDAQNGIRNLRNVLTSEFDLDLTSWTLLSATGITPDGRTIVGNGVNPQGQREAFRAYLGEGGLCRADLDGDGFVGLIDLSTLLANYGTPSSARFADGDITGDGAVGIADLSILLSRFGQTCP